MKKGKVWTYLADITPLLEEEAYRKALEKVPDFRREKAQRLRFREDQAQSVGAWLLLMKARNELGASPEQPFNLSHSGRYVLATVGPEGEKAGCDIETVKRFHRETARRFFCPSEYDTIVNAEGEKQKELFYRFWVLKESFMKATRYGMVLGLDSFEIRLEEGREPVLMRQPEKVKEAYFFREFQTPGADARIAVCSTCRQILEPVWRRL